MRTRKQSQYLTLAAVLTAALIAIPIGTAHSQTTPILEVNPDTLHFYADFCGDPMPGDTMFQTFMVANVGGGSMNWTGTAGESWVVFDPMQGGNYDSVYVGIDWSMTPVIFAAPQPGDTLLFETQIVIEAPGAVNSPQQVVVQLGYICDPADYFLVAYPHHFELAAPPNNTLEQWFYVLEVLGAHIEFYFTNNSNWLHLPQTFAPLYTPDSVQFMVSTFGLDPGVYYDTITIASGEASNIATIPVQLTVGQADFGLAATPSFFNFTVPPGVPILGESLYVYEAGGHSVNFWTYNEASWLYVDTMVASPLYTPRLLTVNIYADTLEPGFYYDTIFIYGEDADSLLVPVYLHVQGENAVVHAAPDFFHFMLAPGDSVPSASMLVYEENGDSVAYAVSVVGESSWLYLPLNLSLGITPDSFYFGIYTNGLAPGTYGDSLLIYYPLDDLYGFDEVIVPVILTISGDPPAYDLETDPASFNFELAAGEYAYDSLWVFDIYRNQIPFYFYNSQPWLAVDPLGMFPYLTPASLLVIANAGGLAPGLYIDTIFIQSLVEDSLAVQTLAVPVMMTVDGFQVCGDANGDNITDIGDAVFLINYIFREGSAPASFKSADTNFDGTVNIGDVVVIVAYIFRAGPAPACP